MSQILGIVVSGFGGFYQVYLKDGKIINCKPRGILKEKYSKIHVGDKVEIILLSQDSGIIENIEKRDSFLPRPNIVNVNHLLIVLSWELPKYDLLLLDRMLVIAQEANINPIICFNKTDLISEEEKVIFAKIKDVYEQTGFPFLALSAYTNYGIDLLHRYLGSGTSVLAGPSGVGKTSILNCLIPNENAQVRKVSNRLKRGRHTTRYNRILPLPFGNGFIADTPGFFIIELPDKMKPQELLSYYPDFQIEKKCRFEGCLHNYEPNCAIKIAVEADEIDKERYQRYLRLLGELQRKEVRY